MSVIKLGQNGEKLPLDGLSHESLQLIEMWASFVKHEGKKHEVSTQLQSMLYQFQFEGLFLDQDSRPAFFLSKSQTEIDSLKLNYHLLQAFTSFNSAISDPDNGLYLPVPNLRNYFLKRAQIAKSLEHAYLSLQGLKQLSKVAPFLQLQSAQEVDIAAAAKESASYQFQDMLGHLVTFDKQPTAVKVVSSYTKSVIDRTDAYTLKKASLTVQLKDLPLGNYWVMVDFTEGARAKLQ